MGKTELLTSPIFIALAIIGALLLGLSLGILIGKISKGSEIRQHRDDAIKRSRNSILGEIYEKIMPFLGNFEFSPKDMVFVGKGFDYLVLDGLNDGELREIIFLEVKYGSSSLNRNEKMIRQAVGSKKVRYVEFKIPKMESR